MIQAHKLVLAASSDYFRKIFQQCPAQNPIIVCGGKHFEQMESIVKFIYQGENQLREDHLQGFRQACQEFQIHLPDNIKYHPLPRTPQQKTFDEACTKTSTNAPAKPLIPPPPLKKRKIVKPEYNVPSQLQQLLQQLPGLASAATKKESSLARDSPLNLSLIGSSKKEATMQAAIPSPGDSSTKVSKPNMIFKDVNHLTNICEDKSEPQRDSQNDLQEDLSVTSNSCVGVSTSTQPDAVQNGGPEGKISDSISDASTVETNAEKIDSREELVESCIDAENLKKALDNFTAKLSGNEPETEEISQDASQDMSLEIKHELVDMTRPGLECSSTSSHAVNEVVRTDTGTNSNRMSENDELDEVSEDENLSDLESDINLNSAPRYDQAMMRTSEKCTSVQTVQSSFKSKAKVVASKTSSYPPIHQQQEYQNFVPPYGFDPERLIFSNCHNPFMNPNLLLDPKHLLANLNSSLTAHTATHQRQRKPNLPKKPLKLVTKKPPKRVDFQWPPKKHNSVSSTSNSSNHLGASSSHNKSPFNLLRNILTQPTPKKSKPCTATSSDTSAPYSIPDFNISQYPSATSSASWANNESSCERGSQKSLPKPKIKRSTQYNCSVCSREFIYFKAYQEHLNSHISAIHCPGCTKTFASRGFLERHLDSGKCSMKKK
ncbi:unnamed protein product [Allacma fusca]|uniref:Uncharacterized protein n=1 Tax=Allacma fusca TaxID=39272 RepID=A0A8J2P0K8_9HEXA|nr:unnamed protein product [Allacma fusca]